MEEDGDDLDNLFEEYEENEHQPPQDDVNNENTENEVAVPEKVPVPKRVVKPRLKFNPERLCGKKGLPILVDHFKDVKFKGKGHEKEDLKKLLTTLELWTHRLFPSMRFEDTLRQIEHLGKKRPVKTCVQKIRNDFPILDQDFVRNEDEEEEETQPNEPAEAPVQDAFDRLFDGYQESAPALPLTSSSFPRVENVLGNSFGASMSEEQKKRMEYNKRLAVERRKARESAAQSNNLVTDAGSTTNAESSLISSTVEGRDNTDANFLFDYLQEQCTNTEVLNKNETTDSRSCQSVQPKEREESEMEGMIELVADGEKDETDHDGGPKVGNNECPEDGGEELGLDDLMNLVDEDEGVETDHKICVKVNDENEEDKTDFNASSNVVNSNCQEGNGSEELELDELMDLGEEGDKDETDLCKNNSGSGKEEVDHDVLSNVKNDISKGNYKKESELDEPMDLLVEDYQDEKL